MNIPESWKWPNSADADSGCARAQITYKHQDKTQIIRLQETRQNVDKQNKKSEKLNKQKQYRQISGCYKYKVS